MAATITQICNPEHNLEGAIRLARGSAAASPGFELHLVQFLQSRCLSRHISHPLVFRGLEVLGGLINGSPSEGSRLITMIRPFLMSSDPQIASKAVLVLGRQSHNLAWLGNVISETDQRIRANVIESLWNRREPEIEAVFRSALMDPHPRVVANAVYGLYKMDSGYWTEGLDNLITNSNAAFRKSGIWVIESAAPSDAPLKLQHLIHDPDPDVRSSAFHALKHLRERARTQVQVA
jgi:hypothetical protein